MSEKRKAERRLHPLIFLVGWSAILIVGWAFTILSIFEMSWFLPFEARYFLRRNVPFEVREAVVVTSFIAMGLAIPTAQRYLLNRSFALRLDGWWIVLTFFGYTAGFYTAWNVGFLHIFPDAVLIALMFICPMGIPSALQWWLLRKRWHHAWVWIAVSLISGFLIYQLSRIFVYIDIEWMYLDYTDAMDLIPSGLAHGLLTGITALALDWITRRKTLEKNKFADI